MDRKKNFLEQLLIPIMDISSLLADSKLQTLNKVLKLRDDALKLQELLCIQMEWLKESRE